MLAAWPKSMTKISDRIQMTAKLPHEVKLLVASSSLCFRGILHDKEATIFFFESVSKEKPMLPNVIFSSWNCIYLSC